MKNRTFWFFTFALIAALLVPATISTFSTHSGIVPLANAAENGCNLQTLHGSYIYSADGYASTAPGQFTPIAEAGVYTFDGDGKLSTTNTLSFGGQIIPRTDTGTYSVNSDCTGSVTLDHGVTFSFAITRSSSEMRLVVSTPTAVVAGTMVRQ